MSSILVSYIVLLLPLPPLPVIPNARARARAVIVIFVCSIASSYYPPPPEEDDRSKDNTPGRKAKLWRRIEAPPPLLLLCLPMSIFPDPPSLPYYSLFSNKAAVRSGGIVKVRGGRDEEYSSDIFYYWFRGIHLCCCYFLPAPSPTSSPGTDHNYWDNWRVWRIRRGVLSLHPILIS